MANRHERSRHCKSKTAHSIGAIQPSGGNRPIVSGVEGMLGQTAEALEDFAGRGNIFLDGERWLAESLQPVKKGQHVRVIALHGLVVNVEPMDAAAK